MSENRYINLVKTSFGVIQNSHLPLHSSKFSKRRYTQHQLLTLIILKEEIGMDYREFTELMQVLTPIQDVLELKSIPHFTTLQKFLTRNPSLALKNILKCVIRLLHEKGEEIKNTPLSESSYQGTQQLHLFHIILMQKQRTSHCGGSFSLTPMPSPSGLFSVSQRSTGNTWMVHSLKKNWNNSGILFTIPSIGRTSINAAQTDKERLH